MCNFFSALVLKNGDIVWNEMTDSHRDLIELAGLSDDHTDRSAFASVEYAPHWRYDNINQYVLHIENERKPEWWTEKLAAQTEKKCRAIVEKRIISYNRKILLGGPWILTGDATVERARNARIIAMYNQSKIGTLYDSSQVGSLYHSSRVGTLYDSSRVRTLYDSSQVGTLYDFSCVGTLYDSSQVGTLYDFSQVVKIIGPYVRVLEDKRDAVKPV